MADRREQKARARAERRRLEQEQAAADSRRQRVRRLGGVLAGAVILVGIAIAVSSGSKSPPKPTAAVTGTVGRLLAGIPQSGNRLGLASAPVTVTEFGDLECPICRDFTLGAENQLISNDVRSGRVQLIYRSLATATGDPSTFETQQAAALAAGQQQHMWDFVELFYQQQGSEGSNYVTAAYLDGLARQVPGLDQNAWLRARGSAALVSEVRADEAQAQSKGFDSTPTILVAGPRGAETPIVGGVDYPTLEQAVRQAA